CRAGRLVWMRLRERASNAQDRPASGPVRSTPLVLLPRRDAPAWAALAGHDSDAETLSSRAQAVAEALTEQGAMFFDELIDCTHLLPTELENALGELVAAGRINADSFAGLRALLLPASKRKHRRHRRVRRHTLSGIADAGRWSLIRRNNAADDQREQCIEHLVHTLLRRYGVICWRLLEREPAWLPTWRELRRVCQRLEARGEIRGGRFIDGLVGEQFALPEAVELLRKTRRQARDGKIITISGSDPLNLVGTLIAGDKIPARSNTRIAWRDGVPIAACVAGQAKALVDLDIDDQTALRRHAFNIRLAHPEPARAVSEQR
ncbi:MAG: ATP-dependent DNA helicase, partial [Rhodanobacteraceae bacterium]